MDISLGTCDSFYVGGSFGFGLLQLGDDVEMTYIDREPTHDVIVQPSVVFCSRNNSTQCYHITQNEETYGFVKGFEFFESPLVRVVEDRFGTSSMVHLSQRTPESQDIECAVIELPFSDKSLSQNAQTIFHLQAKDVPPTASLYDLQQQDIFLFAFFDTSRQEKIETCILIYAPDRSLFGKRIVSGYRMVQPLIVGYHVYFCSGSSLYIYDLLTEKLQPWLEHPKRHDICTFTMVTDPRVPPHASLPAIDVLFFVDKHNQLYGCMNSDTQYPLDACLHPQWIGVLPCKGIVRSIVSSQFGLDYRHPLSPLSESGVRTYYIDQMTLDELSLRDMLVEFSKKVYHSKLARQHLFDFVSNDTARIYPKTFRDLYKGIYIGNDIQAILHPPRFMFARHTNYQHLLQDMGHILNDPNELYDFPEHLPVERQRTILRLREFFKDRGIYKMPGHQLSGMIHIIFPNHGKGWHHNIESVPQEEVDVVYFVCTDHSWYGGSFFFYRHPRSKKIHAVPDIQGTMKKFYLQSDPAKVLWHAIGSFTALRISLGLSKKRDMQNLGHLLTSKLHL